MDNLTPIFGERTRLLDRPDVRERLIEAVADGLPLGTAWRLAGLAREGYREWLFAAATGTWRRGNVPVAPESLEIIQSFVERLEQARAKHEAEVLTRISEAGKRENERTGLLEWRANAWLLNNHPDFRQTYHEWKEPRADTSSPDMIRPPSLKDKSDAEIIELAGGQWRELLGEGEIDANPDAE